MIRSYLSVVAAITLFLTSNANALPSRSGGTEIPPPAMSAGYTLNTFSTQANFNSSTVDSAQTYASGYQWYLFNFYGYITAPTDSTLNADGSVTVAGGNANATIASAAHIAGAPGYVGQAFGGGGYFEAEISFNASSVDTTVGWPSWWTEALEQQVPLSGLQWAGQAAGYTHFIENDIFEYDTNTPTTPNEYAANLHDWYGIYNMTCPGYCGVALPFLTTLKTPPVGTNWSIYHRVGMLWIPATPSVNGSICFYLDDELMGSCTSYSQFTTQSPPPTPATPWTWGIIDNQHLTLILGSGGYSAPMNVRSVHVWQSTTANNLVN